MIEIEMPGDITEYEAKVIGSLTARQTICFGLGGILGFISYQLLKNTGIDVTAIILVTAAVPSLCGIYKLYDIPLEKFILMIILTYWLPPTNRKYKTNNMYEECFIKEEITEADDERTKILRSRKKKKKNRRSKNEDIIDYK